jgi:phosphate-selective porin OprO/OprP
VHEIRRRGFAAWLIGAWLWGLPGLAAAADTNAEVLERVQALEAELGLLKRKLEVQEEVAAAKASEAPIIGSGKDGFFIRSQDKKYQLKLRAYTHFDGRFFDEGDDASSSTTDDTFFFRRVRLLFEGTLAEVVDFRVMPELGGNTGTSGSATFNLQDAYVNARYFPAANLQLGKYKSPFGLERLQSATALTFVERGLPTQLVPNRDLGVMVHGALREGLFNYQLAYMDGVGDAGSWDNDENDGKDVVARVFLHPFQESPWPALQGLGYGVAVSWGREDGATPQYRTAGQQTFFRYRTNVGGVTGNDVELAEDRWRYSPQAYWYWGPFGLFGEYVSSTGFVETELAGDSTRAENTSWQVAASWVLTGENASYRGVTPRAPFARDAPGWGAFEVAARYSTLEVDDDVFDDGFADPAASAQQADAWAVGVNWYLNRYLKFVVNYERTSFDGGAPDGGNRESEGVFLTRLQLSY